MKKSAGKFILFGLICAAWTGAADFAFCTTPTHTSSEPSSLISGDGYQLAKTWFLPDWQADTRSYNTDGDNDTDEGGDAGSSCAAYGFQDMDTIDTSVYSCTVVQPVVGLKCYKSCFCKSDFQYSASNCSEDDGKILSGQTCGGLYESCVCKPSVTLGAGEKCDLSCDGACVEKSCAAAVEYDEENGEYCAESCASDSSVCTEKGCNQICKDTFTGDIPTNAHYTTESCSDCSGSYDIKTGWECDVGYHAAGSLCTPNCTQSCYDTYTEALPAHAEYVTEPCSDCSGNYTIKTGWACVSGYEDTDSYWCTLPETTDCGELGYNKTEEECEGADVIKCPFDMSHVWCEEVPVEPEPGMILYSDGTVSWDVISGKTAVGVVAYVEGSTRFAVALEENSSLSWSTPGYENLSCLIDYSYGYEEEAQTDFNGAQNTSCIVNYSSSNSYPAAEYCNSYKPVSSGTGANGWYLPAAGELYATSFSYEVINLGLQKLSKTQLSSNYYWSSSEYNTSRARRIRPSDGTIGYDEKAASYSIRCVLAF